MRTVVIAEWGGGGGACGPPGFPPPDRWCGLGVCKETTRSLEAISVTAFAVGSCRLLADQGHDAFAPDLKTAAG